MPRPKRKNLTDISSEMHAVYIEEFVNNERISAERLGDFLADLEKRVADIESHLAWQATQRRGLGSR